MSKEVPQKLPRFAKLRIENYLLFDSVLLVFYTALVYVWSLTVYPMGRDFAAMDASGEGMPFLADRVFAWEVQTFGASTVPYHLVNLVALYACEWCVMHLTIFTVRGLWWLGTWAAVVFMANPVHTESVLNVSGIGDLIPAFFGLLAITAYSYHAYKPRRWTYALAIATFVYAAAAYPHYAFLFLVIVLFEVLITRPENRNFPRLIPYVIAGMAAVAYHWPTLRESSFDPGAWFEPLYFTFYVIGFLPENAAAMHERAWLRWCAAIAVVVVLWLIYRKARRPAILFALLSMVVLRLFPSPRAVDPVHLVGGGELVVASALFSVAFAALMYRCMDHPKWKIPLVGMTTALAIGLVLVQIRAELNWRAAGRTVKAFQSSAAAVGPTIAVLPDWQYYRGAPLQLSDSIRYDTPFSRAIDHQSILKLNAVFLDDDAATLEQRDAPVATLRINGARPIEVVPWLYGARKAGDELAGAAAVIGSVDDDEFTIRLNNLGQATTVLPASLSLGEESGADTQADTGDEERTE